MSKQILKLINYLPESASYRLCNSPHKFNGENYTHFRLSDVGILGRTWVLTGVMEKQGGTKLLSDKDDPEAWEKIVGDILDNLGSRVLAEVFAGEEVDYEITDPFFNEEENTYTLPKATTDGLSFVALVEYDAIEGRTVTGFWKKGKQKLTSVSRKQFNETLKSLLKILPEYPL